MRNPDSDIVMPLQPPARVVDEEGKPLAGRPRVFTDPRRTCATFEADDLRYIRKLGGGSLSLGIRLMVQITKSNRPAAGRSGGLLPDGDD